MIVELTFQKFCHGNRTLLCRSFSLLSRNSQKTTLYCVEWLQSWLLRNIAMISEDGFEERSLFAKAETIFTHALRLQPNDEVWQYAAVWWSVLQWGAVCWSSVLQCDVVSCSVLQCAAVCCSVLQCAGAVRCSMLQCDAVWCSVLVQCDAVCYNVLGHWVTVCCSVLQCVAAC